MYDASQGARSGAQVGRAAKRGPNEFHGMGDGYYQTSNWNPAPLFRNASPAPPADQKVPYLDNRRYGATLGGPVVKVKLFIFASYQGTQVDDTTLGASRRDSRRRISGSISSG